MTPQLYSTKETAKKLGISIETFNYIIKSGKIKYITVGRNYKFTDDLINEYLTNETKRATK